MDYDGTVSYAMDQQEVLKEYLEDAGFTDIVLDESYYEYDDAIVPTAIVEGKFHSGDGIDRQNCPIKKDDLLVLENFFQVTNIYDKLSSNRSLMKVDKNGDNDYVYSDYSSNPTLYLSEHINKEIDDHDYYSYYYSITYDFEVLYY